MSGLTCRKAHSKVLESLIRVAVLLGRAEAWLSLCSRPGTLYNTDGVERRFLPVARNCTRWITINPLRGKTIRKRARSSGDRASVS
jgi:hypothetical protein